MKAQHDIQKRIAFSQVAQQLLNHAWNRSASNVWYVVLIVFVDSEVDGLALEGEHDVEGTDPVDVL